MAEEATMGSGPPCHGLHLLVSHQSATRDQPASHQQATRSTLVTARSPQHRFAQFATNIATLLVGKKLNQILASYNLVKKIITGVTISGAIIPEGFETCFFACSTLFIQFKA